MFVLQVPSSSHVSILRCGFTGVPIRTASGDLDGEISQVSGPGRVLVTGAAGFIGSHIAEGYLRDGWEVVVLEARTRVADLVAKIARAEDELFPDGA